MNEQNGNSKLLKVFRLANGCFDAILLGLVNLISGAAGGSIGENTWQGILIGGLIGGFLGAIGIPKLVHKLLARNKSRTRDALDSYLHIIGAITPGVIGSSVSSLLATETLYDVVLGVVTAIVVGLISLGLLNLDIRVRLNR